MQRFLAELHARLARQVVEEQTKFSPDKAARRRQAGEWINWPLYITQPIIPILFFLLHFSDVVFIILVVLVVNIIWIRIVSQRFVSPPLLRVSAYIARSKWIAVPLVAVMLWVEGYPLTAIVVLSWPILLMNILFALHRFWPDGALDTTQHMFQAAAKRSRKT